MYVVSSFKSENAVTAVGVLQGVRFGKLSEIKRTVCSVNTIQKNCLQPDVFYVWEKKQESVIKEMKNGFQRLRLFMKKNKNVCYQKR